MNPAHEGAGLVACDEADLARVLGWFSDARSVFYWGGPDLSYPLETARFKDESRFHKSHSYVLRNAAQLLAFGQLYNRLDRIHLGRLVVAPDHRGQGVGEVLINQLISQGRQLLGVAEASLFVLSDNAHAMKLYQRMGFVETPYPKPIPLANCLYMIKPAQP